MICGVPVPGMLLPVVPVPTAPSLVLPRLFPPTVVPALPPVEMPALVGLPVEGDTDEPVLGLVTGALGMTEPGGVAV